MTLHFLDGMGDKFLPGDSEAVPGVWCCVKWAVCPFKAVIWNGLRKNWIALQEPAALIEFLSEKQFLHLETTETWQ